MNIIGYSIGRNSMFFVGTFRSWNKSMTLVSSSSFSREHPCWCKGPNAKIFILNGCPPSPWPVARSNFCRLLLYSWWRCAAMSCWVPIMLADFVPTPAWLTHLHFAPEFLSLSATILIRNRNYASQEYTDKTFTCHTYNEHYLSSCWMGLCCLPTLPIN